LADDLKHVDVVSRKGQACEIVVDDNKVIDISAEMTSRYFPKLGDYYVVQEDGYAYLNPKDVLDRKYRPLTLIIDPLFAYVGLNARGQVRASAISVVFSKLLSDFQVMCPSSREFSICMTHLETACMFAKKAISRDQMNQNQST
jgi:hypothetical protein